MKRANRQQGLGFTPRLRSRRGSVTLIGLVLVLLLASLSLGLFSMLRISLGQARLQAQTDHALLSGVDLLARGMNILVFVNWVMAALIAVLIALKLAQTLMLIAALVLTGLAWPTFGATIPWAALATEKANFLGQAYDRAKGVVFPMLEGLHQTEDALRVVVPSLALWETVQAGAEQGKPLAWILPWPGSLTLPVEPDRFEVLCGRGAKLAAGLALEPLSSLGEGARKLLSAVEGAVQELGEKTSSYLCGDGQQAPPSHQQKVQENRPLTGDSRACEKTGDKRACAQWEQFMEDARPNAQGNCRREADCSKQGAYFKSAAMAREQCEPDPKLRFLEFTWQKSRVELEILNTQPPQILTRRMLEQALVVSKQRPCGPGGLLSQETELRSQDERGEALAYCAKYPLELRSLTPNTKHLVVIWEATHLFSCSVEREVEIPLAKEEDRLGAQSEKRSPHRVTQSAQLGSEAFQLRVLGHGEVPSGGRYSSASRLLLGTEVVGAQPESSMLQVWQGLLGNGVAQGEFFFDAQDQNHREDWLWESRWRSRLRRVRLPESSQAPQRGGSAPELSSADRAAREKYASNLDTPPQLQSSAEADSFVSLEKLIVH